MKSPVRLYSAILGFLLLTIATTSQAIPAFSARENLNCNSCHSAVPALNGVGRNYKLQGYVMYEQQRRARPNPRSNAASLENVLPISAGIIARPYDKKDSGEGKIRAIHEVELMVAGQIAQGFSGFIELEGEDEEDFDVSVDIAQGSYRLNSALNFQVSRAPSFYFDPYNSYSSSRRITINRNAVIDQSFGGADNGSSLRRNRQNLTVFGKADNLFYGLSFSGVANDNEGEDAGTLIGRIAYELNPNFIIGGMHINGSCSRQSGGGNNPGDPCFLADRDYSRSALDVEWSGLNNLILNAVYMQADDDLINGIGEESNDSFYIQGFYNLQRQGQTFITPIARYDSYEISNGLYQIDMLTLGISNYIRQNINLRAEFSDLSGAGPVADDSRFTLQVNAYF
tara:strand:- start:177289 stop:178482 length:1194 start_codon:yes stop_codon:yes gene_type:complete